MLVNTEVEPLLLDTLDTIHLILRYLPEDCVFNYQLVDVLLKFLSLDAFRTSAMRCLQEILTHPASARYPSLVLQSLRRFLDFLAGLSSKRNCSRAFWTPRATWRRCIPSSRPRSWTSSTR